MGCGLGASLQEHIQTSQLYFCSSAISLLPEDKVQDSRHEYSLGVTLQVMSLQEFLSIVSILGIQLFRLSFFQHMLH